MNVINEIFEWICTVVLCVLPSIANIYTAHSLRKTQCQFLEYLKSKKDE